MEFWIETQHETFETFASRRCAEAIHVYILLCIWDRPKRCSQQRKYIHIYIYIDMCLWCCLLIITERGLAQMGGAGVSCCYEDDVCPLQTWAECFHCHTYCRKEVSRASRSMFSWMPEAYRESTFFKLVADALTLFKVVCLLSVVCRLRLDSVFDVIILYEDFQV